MEPERGYRYSAEASPSVAGPRDSPFRRAKNLSVIVAGRQTDHPGRLCRTESALSVSGALCKGQTPKLHRFAPAL